MTADNGSRPEVRTTGLLRGMAARASTTIESVNDASKRFEETANWVAVALACVAAVSIVALGIAVVALIGSQGCGGKDVEPTNSG